MYSGDFWSLKWFWFLHLGESRWWGAALSHGWSHRHGRGCNAFPWPFHVSMAAVYPLPDTSRAPVGHLKAFNSAFRSARNFCWKSWHMWRGECWKRGQALKIQCLWQTLDTLGTHLPKNSFGTGMMRDFWARCPKDVLRKILTDCGRRNVWNFSHALSCCGPATTRHLLDWLVASTSEWVVGLIQMPNRGARARWSERQFRYAKIKCSKPFSKHNATNAPVCKSVYI